MDLEFQPLGGADKLRFGTKRNEIRNFVLEGKSFRTPPNEPENDMYEGEGLILGYNGEDELEFIEVVSPSTCQFSGISLIGRSLTEVLEEMRQHGYVSLFEGDSHSFAELRIVLFCPEGNIGSASIYTEGYYDDV